MDSFDDKTLQPGRSQLSDLGASPESRIVTVIQQLLIERSISGSVYADDDLFQVGLNSLDMLNLVLSLEAEFNLAIPEVEITIANLRTVAALSNLISRLQHKSDALYAK